MKCPICGADTKVVDSRANLGRVRRTRACFHDKYHRFPTVELPEGELTILAERKDIVKSVDRLEKKLDTVIELLKKHTYGG